MKVSILQWNILYEEKIENIAEFLRQVNADIVCLQELSIGSKKQVVDNSLEFIAAKTGYNYHHVEIPTHATDGSSMKLANGIFTRMPIISKTLTWINKPTGSRGYDDEYRAYIEATIKIGNQQLRLGTVHMSYTHEFQVTDGKVKETDKLLEYIKRNRQGFVMAGDFNSLPSSSVISKINRRLKNVGPDFAEKTWTTKPFSYRGFEANTLDWRLDYIFASSDIKVNSAKILDTSFSDHLPILAEIDFG